MCSHYQALKERERYRRHFAVEPPADLGKHDLWPGYLGSFVRRHPQADVGDDAVPEREALAGVFGLLPQWARDRSGTRYTYNARSETAAQKPSFRLAWQQAQHCIIPAEAIYEPDWRSGRPLPTRIHSADEQPLGLAGLWASWRSPQGELLHSYTMLTINADDHPLLRQFHKPGEEKRMVVILRPQRYADWLHASAAHSWDYLRPYPAELLQAQSPERTQARLSI